MYLEEFDIIYISGYKWRTAKWDKIVKIRQEDLVKFATNSGKYNPEDTVAAVKARRLVAAAAPAEIKPQETKQIQSDNSDNINDEDNTSDDIENENIQIDEIETIEEAINENEFIDTDEDIVVDNEDIKKASDIYTSEELSDSNELEEVPEEVVPEEVNKEYIYNMPWDISIIKQIWTIIKSNSWDIKVTIWTMNILLNQYWVDQIDKILKQI